MSKELIIGAVSIIAIALFLWGYQFVKGKNILGKVQTFHTTYDNVEGLKMAAPVEINGYVVGSVSKIEMNPQEAKSMMISFDVQGDWKLPSNTIARLSADNSLVGSKKIILDFDEICTTDCAQSGDYMEPGYRGMLESIIGTDDLRQKMSVIREESSPILDSVLYTLTDPNSDNVVSNSLTNLESTLDNMNRMTNTMNRLMAASYDNLSQTVQNMAIVTGSLANTNDDLELMISNMASLSQQIVDADLGSTLGRTSETFDNTNKLLLSLDSTVTKASGSFDKIDGLLQSVESGDGSIAKLLNDPGIYDNLDNTTKNLSLLLQDMRLNPKRYVRLSVFGRKGNQYTSPEEDPAFELEQTPKN
jgi:phospholipid/cholesterol/gamma-HCH transport system substrate-binding protein